MNPSGSGFTKFPLRSLCLASSCCLAELVAGMVGVSVSMANGVEMSSAVRCGLGVLCRPVGGMVQFVPLLPPGCPRPGLVRGREWSESPCCPGCGCDAEVALAAALRLEADGVLGVVKPSIVAVVASFIDAAHGLVATGSG